MPDINAWYFLYPLVAHIVATAIKIATEWPRTGRSMKVFYQYGGFPSSHTAIVTSITTIILLEEGWNNLLFTLSLVLSILVIRDAFGLRMIVEEHSKAINILGKKEHENFHEVMSVGHTWYEVVGGAVVGVAVTTILFLFIPN